MEITTKAQFWEEAQKFVDRNFPPSSTRSPRVLPTIEPCTPEFRAWFEYFHRHLGWHSLPAIMRGCVTGQHKAMTVPCKDPETFDLTFTRSAGFQYPAWAQRELKRFEKPAI